MMLKDNDLERNNSHRHLHRHDLRTFNSTAAALRFCFRTCALLRAAPRIATDAAIGSLIAGRGYAACHLVTDQLYPTPIWPGCWHGTSAISRLQHAT